MAKNEIKTHIFQRFNDITSFYSHLEKSEKQPSFDYKYGSETNDEKFAGTKDYQEAVNLLFHGDKTLADKIEKNGVSATRMKLQRTYKRPRFTTSVQGFAPHVQNFLAGRPNAMITRRDAPQKTKVLSIAYNICAACNVTADAIMRAAVKFVSAAMQIEAAGIRLNISTCCIAREDDTCWGFDVRIKSAGQAFDVLKMAFPMAHPSMLRRIAFRHTETTPGVPSSACYGYGFVIKESKEAAAQFERAGIRHDVILSYYDIESKTTEEVIQTILGADK